MINSSVSTILVIDDEPQNFDVIEGFLRQKNYQLHYCNSGQEAFNSLDFIAPDLILLDIMMPNLSGIEVCQIIKANPKWQNISIIIVTALTSKKELAYCLEIGADDFINKPIDSIELLARIQSMLRIKKQYDKLEKFSLLQRDTINILGKNLDELKSSVAVNLSQELNTPLNGLVGVLNLLKDNLKKLNIDDDIEEMLALAVQSANRLEELTKKILIYIELELNTNEQKTIRSTQTTHISESIIEEAAFKVLTQRNNRISDIIMEIEEVEIHLSEQHLLIILHELIDNALKFSQPGTVVKIKSKVLGKMLDFSIEDHGTGMTSEQISEIDAFKQFERKTYAQQGLGIGLKIVQKIVELAKGKFSITSIYQQKTIVNITIPIVRNPAIA